ncbi:MAG: branched-chain-amino-acid transaminase [Bacillota bacterium]
MNGDLVPEEDATVSVFDHGFLYGDGVFEGIRAYGGKVFRLREHVQRLYESAHCIMMDIPYEPAELERAIIDTVKANDLIDAYIRVVVSRGKGDLGLSPKNCARCQVVIIAGEIAVYPAELYRDGIEAVTVPTRRNSVGALDPRIKSLNYLNNILGHLEAARAGVREALMLNSDGYVTEGAADNLFVYRKGILSTPPVYLGILEGITRESVMELARQEGVPVEERPITRHDIYTADECFVTGTAAEIMPIVEVDARTVGEGVPGPLTKRLTELYGKLVIEEGTPVH